MLFPDHLLSDRTVISAADYMFTDSSHLLLGLHSAELSGCEPWQLRELAVCVVHRRRLRAGKCYVDIYLAVPAELT